MPGPSLRQALASYEISLRMLSFGVGHHGTRILPLSKDFVSLASHVTIRKSCAATWFETIVLISLKQVEEQNQQFYSDSSRIEARVHTHTKLEIALCRQRKYRARDCETRDLYFPSRTCASGYPHVSIRAQSFYSRIIACDHQSHFSAALQTVAAYPA